MSNREYTNQTQIYEFVYLYIRHYSYIRDYSNG